MIDNENLVENPTQNEPNLVENPTSDTKEAINQAAQQATAEAKQQQEPERERIQSIRFSEMRTALEQAKRERDLLLLEKQQQQEQRSQKEEEDLRLSPDEFAEGNITKLHKTVKKLEQEIKKSKEEARREIAEAKLRAQYRDIDTVVNPEAVAELYRQHPETELAIKAMGDTYAQGAFAYKMIKHFGLYREDNYTAEKERIAKNMAKPKSSQSVPVTGDSPLAFAASMQSGLSEDVKDQLRKEMAAAAAKFDAGQTY